MSKSGLTTNELSPKTGTDISQHGFLKNDVAHTTLDFQGANNEERRLIPYEVALQLVTNSVAPQNRMVVSSNPFVYASGITTYVPQYRLFLSIGDDLLPFAGDMKYNDVTGDITVQVDYATDIYVLVVG